MAYVGLRAVIHDRVFPVPLARFDRRHFFAEILQARARSQVQQFTGPVELDYASLNPIDQGLLVQARSPMKRQTDIPAGKFPEVFDMLPGEIRIEGSPTLSQSMMCAQGGCPQTDRSGELRLH